MSIRVAREQIGRLFTQRFFYLFIVLLTLVVGVPFVEPTNTGRLAISAVNALVVIARRCRRRTCFRSSSSLSPWRRSFAYLGMTWGPRNT
jgi:hypothetical protein